VRPVTAIRHFLGVSFDSFILTTPFPSYKSGHAATSGAASEFLSCSYPAEVLLLRAMWGEAAMCRLFGGIHYRFDNEVGLKVGRAVGELALDKYNFGR
jgi:hypothetical protein